MKKLREIEKESEMKTCSRRLEEAHEAERHLKKLCLLLALNLHQGLETLKETEMWVRDSEDTDNGNFYLDLDLILLFPP